MSGNIKMLENQVISENKRKSLKIFEILEILEIKENARKYMNIQEHTIVIQ